MPIPAKLRVPPEVYGDQELFKKFVAKHLKIGFGQIKHIEILHKSIDARQKVVHYEIQINVHTEDFIAKPQWQIPSIKPVSNDKRILIVGFGPAGIFAALRCLELGGKPIVLERGKNAKDRVADLKGINVHNIVNPDSNYCFGEGGAGTYSDGKLYTRSQKRGNVRMVLEYLVRFGANPNILIEAHPHIGTNLLPGIIQRIRQFILDSGGEIHFHSRVTDIKIISDEIQGVFLQTGDFVEGSKVLLATGHSARDIFKLLETKKIFIQAKPLAIGVRVEHAQSLIDSIQYHRPERGPYLPPAEYSLVKQIGERGVYSFCMCPGGVIAPCATETEQIVTNGWSSSERSRPTANSGIVVQLFLSDYSKFEKFGALSGMMYQGAIEHRAWLSTGKTQKAPAQRMEDFVQGKVSESLPKTSYPPGLVSQNLKDILPPLIYETLQKGFIEFGKMKKGYFTNEAVIHAPETRTSSPVQIPRDPKTLEHPQVKGLYPCGEGAGYAGGIISAAMDGWKCAEAMCQNS